MAYDQLKLENQLCFRHDSPTRRTLVDQQGNVIERFEPTATEEVLAPAIEALLK